MIVTFFGHSNTPQTIQKELKTTICNLIETQNASVFYVGNHGNFDRYVSKTLKELTKQYPFIKYYTVLAYMPQKLDEYTDYTNSILPEDVAKSHSKYAISKRNDWMLKQSDTIVAYVKHSHGGAARYYQKATSQGKAVVNLAEMKSS